MRSERGFTLVELSIVVSIFAILLPAIFLFERSFESAALRADAALDAAAGMRSFSEELRLDLRTLHLGPEDLALSGGCGTVRYTIVDGALVRDAGSECGGRRALARHVASVTRRGALVEVVFSTPVGRKNPETTSFVLGLPEAAK